jgi:ribosomal protein L11 methyltransferase
MTDQADEPPWFVVEARVDEDELDILSGELWSACVAGIEERPTADGVVIVVSAAEANVGAVKRLVGERLLRVRQASVDEGLDGWREWATHTRVGDVVIEPAWWVPADATGSALTVRIDPGHAFGSGAHVTTRLALELMQDSGLRGRTVLDVGTGSGVLAIVAAGLGASRVVGIDVDDVARDVARVNVDANAVDAVVDIRDSSVDLLDEQFDIVVANIDASTLIVGARSITARLEPEGTLILSGMLTARERDVTSAFDDVVFGERREEQGWVAIASERAPVS